MTTTAPPQPSAAFPRHPPFTPGRWVALLAASGLMVLVLDALHLSGAWLLGPMAAAIAFAARGRAPAVPPLVFTGAQALVGCMIARSMPPAVLGEALRQGPVFVVAVSAVVVVAAALGWAMSRWRWLPGTTAVWGTFPGAATAMVLMGEANGADGRLVALMQYLRVLMVGVAATTVTRLWLPSTAHHAPLIPAASPIHAGALLGTLALAALGVVVARRFLLAAGALLLPMFGGIALQAGGWLRLELPWWLLALAYALVGWTIGARFTRDVLGHAAALLPRVVGSIAFLIVVCAGFAAVLAQVAHVDPLTAYLATSPGGADTVAIIASGSPVDVPFVMAMQSARFLLIAFLGPAIARVVARHLPSGVEF